MPPFLSAGQAVALSLGRWLARHHMGVVGSVAALMLVAGGGAFALASLAPDASELPVHQVMQTVQPLALPDVATDSANALVLYRTDSTRSTDTADTLLKRLGVDDAPAAAFLRSDRIVQQLLLGRQGRQVNVQTQADHSLSQLTARWTTD